MRRTTRLLIAIALLLAVTLAPARTTLKLATLAPDGSVWHTGLQEMGAEWKQASGGEGNLRVYPGGVAGDELDMMRKMRTGQLHAATLTVSGLAQIDGAFAVFTMPLFYDSYDELWHVVDELEPAMRSRLEERGYVLLAWGLGGWVHLFSKRPVRRVEDLQKTKMFASAGDDDWVQLWKGRGYNPVPLAMTDIQTGLQTGLIDGVPTTPLACVSLQWYRHLPFMYAEGIAPLLGATLVSKKAWDRMSERERETLVKAAAKLEETLKREIPRQDAAAIEEMKKRGLTVTTATSDSEPGWKRESEALADYVRSTRLPEGIFDRALRARDAYRESNGVK